MSDTFHVMPIADLVAHEATETCACGPTPELVQRRIAGDAWLWVHHSLDGREARERARDG